MKKFIQKLTVLAIFVVGLVVCAPVQAQTNTPAGVTASLVSGAGSGFDSGVNVFVAATTVCVVIGFILKGLSARKR